MTYKAFNLQIHTPFECPELVPLTSEDNTLDHVTIRLDETPEHLTPIIHRGAIFEANDEAYLFRIKEVGAFLVRGGNEIIIDVPAEVDMPTVRLHLFGTIFGALLHQRGALTFQAAAIEHNGQAILFVGPSGAGKTTILHAFLKRGYRMLSDEMGVIIQGDDTRLYAVPTFPQTKVWKKALERLSLQSTTLTPVHAGLQKYWVPITELFAPFAVPVKSIYVLGFQNDDSAVKLIEVHAMKRFYALQSNVFRLRMLDHLANRRKNFKLMQEVAHQCSVKHCLRPVDQETVTLMADTLESDFT